MSVSQPVVLDTQETVLAPVPGDRRRVVGMWIGLAVIVVVAAALRLINLEHSPGWDGDEGYNLNIANNLLQGHLRMYAVKFAFVQHPPLFFLILAGFIQILGAKITTLRMLAATYGILSTTALFVFGRKFVGDKAALWAAALFAIHPLAVTNTRWGYTYSQLMLISIPAFYAIWRYASTTSRRWLYCAAILAGLGLVSDQEGVFLVVFLALVVLWTRWRDVLPALLLSLLFPLIYILTMLLIAPAIFMSDLQFTYARVAGDSALLQGITLLISYKHYLDNDYWIPLGIAGLLLVKELRVRWLLLSFYLILLFFVLKVRDPNPYFHHAVPLLPWIALGMGCLLSQGVEYLYQMVTLGFRQVVRRLGGDPTHKSLSRAERFSGVLALFLIIFSPLGIQLAIASTGVATQAQTPLNFSLVTQTRDAEAVATTLNAQLGPEDVVLCAPQLTWLFHGLPTDILQAIVASGEGTAFYPAHLPRSHFVYDPSLANAKYVIIDPLVRSLAAPGQVSQMPALLATVTTWPVVVQKGAYIVYRNPNR